MSRSSIALATASPACWAPMTSMYLDQYGDVRACCMNIEHPLGNIRDRALADIWWGERAERLRAAVTAGDLSLGCEWCQGPVAAGRPDLAFARWFDRLVTPGGPAGWPVQIEFSVSNTCNLQCVMCNGDWSSSIRSQREHRPPLESPYGEAFFEQLDEFLDHVQRVKFLGGEPFLASETLRTMERLIDGERRPACHITTNGTQWSPRVERILELLPVDIALSLDAATRETYEAIRVGSSWDGVMANLDRFRARAQRAGTVVDLTYCLMVPNWREFGAFCRFADDLGLACTANQVVQPAHLSLYHAGLDVLEEAVAGMEAEGVDLVPTLGRSRPTWEGELDRLRRRRDEWRTEVETGVAAPGSAGSSLRHDRSPPVREELARWRRAHVGSSPAQVRLSVRSRIVGFEPAGPLASLAPDDVVGRGSGELEDLIRGLYPAAGEPALVDERHGCLALRAALGEAPDLVILVEPEVDDQGYERGTTLWISSAADLARSGP